MSVPSVSPPASPAQGNKIAHFVGDTGDYWRLLIRGNVLVAVTLGIYRFWLTTDMRRFLWSHTQIGGETLEYTGRGIELFLGFLIAIAVLVPIYVGVIGVSFAIPGWQDLGTSILFLVLFVLGQFAVYRARRYRLTRTVFRGVRLHQNGSAWIYAFRAVAWWIPVFLTLGLAYPWAQANLERYKMRHTFFGDMPGRFDGTGTSLFLRYIVLWLILVVPAALMLARVSAADWSLLVTQIAQSARGGTKASPTMSAAALALVFAPLWIIFVGMLLAPAYEAIVMRWWLSGVRFGEIALTSNLRKRSVYGIYLRFLLGMFLLSIAGGIVGGVIAGFVATTAISLKGSGAAAVAAQVLGTIFGVVLYVAYLLAVSTIYQVVVKLALWRLAVESLDVSNFHLVELVKAEGQQSSPFGEGLADALNVGSF
jgi:uncharacterized membrane protein YjgN (DUF898 family)